MKFEAIRVMCGGASLFGIAIPRAVMAVRRGPLAIHPSTCCHGLFGVTHVASGFSCWDDIKGFAAASRVCDALLALPVSWAFTEPEAARSFGPMAKAAIQAALVDGAA